MTDPKTITDALAENIEAYALKESFVAYADHKNLWIDLGWDLSCGDGEISMLFDKILRHKISGYADYMQYLIWSETVDARIERNRAISYLTGAGGVDELFPPEPEEIFEQTVNHVSAEVFRRAEEAYDTWDEEE